MELRTAEIAAAAGGRVEGPDVVVDGATTDSRALHPGQLFVPVVAARDGHDFIADALDAGAGAYLSARAPIGRATAVVVEDTVAALAATGSLARDRLGAVPVVGITGSVGKTSVKDLLHGVLSVGRRTAASERSFNNELGVPLTLLNAVGGTEAVVVEMGARGPGHIEHLCRIARPTVGVVTRVEAAHTEAFGTLDRVAAAKGELVAALPAAGVAVLNADDARVAAMAGRTAARTVRYGGVDGSPPGAVHVTARDVTLDDELRPRFRLHSDWGVAEVVLGVRGRHQVANALAAAAAALSLDTPIEDVAGGLAAASLSPWRMDLTRTAGGAVVLNDAYNANPSSMVAALDALAALPATRRTAVLGVMAELGELHEAEHRRVGAHARALGIRTIAVAEPAYGADVEVDGLEAAAGAVGPLEEGHAVLVKGSRTAGLEVLAGRLTGPAS